MIREELRQLAMPIKNMQPHPKNVRQGDIGAISVSLEQHGQYRPIVVQKSTGYILAGNHTYKAAVALKWKEIAATYVDCDDEQALRILLVDNKTSDLAIYDEPNLAELLKELSQAEIELQGTGFDGDDLDDLLFKLEGSVGFLTEGQGSDERQESWEQKGIRSIILPYPEIEWETVTAKLKQLRERYGVENNADVVAKLVGNACA